MARSKTAPQKPAEETFEMGDPSEVDESGKPDYQVTQYRQIRTEKGTKTRRETVGVIWRNPTSGSLKIRFNGVQIISNDLFAFPVTYEFTPS